MLYSKSFKEAYVKELLQIAGRINPVEIVTPSNVGEAKKSWVESVKDFQLFIDPYFVYDRKKLLDVLSHGNKLQAIRNNFTSSIEPENEVDQVVYDLLIKRIDQAIVTTEIAAGIYVCDDLRVSELCESIYGTPSPEQIRCCYDIAVGKESGSTALSRFSDDEQKKLEAMTFDARQIADWFEEALEYYCIGGWAIDTGSEYTSIDVRTKNLSGRPVICIPEDRVVNGLKLLELIGHEIESHLRSAENAHALFNKLLGGKSPLAHLSVVLAKSDNELLDEGQAKLSDVSINGTAAIPAPYYTIAIDLAHRENSFKEVAEQIFWLQVDKGATIEKAAKSSWTTTYRVFRGTTTPSAKNGYAFTKDYIYFAGYNTAKEIDPKYLQYASLDTEEIKRLSALGLIDEPAYKNLDAVEHIKASLLS